MIKLIQNKYRVSREPQTLLLQSFNIQFEEVALDQKEYQLCGQIQYKDTILNNKEYILSFLQDQLQGKKCFAELYIITKDQKDQHIIQQLFSIYNAVIEILVNQLSKDKQEQKLNFHISQLESLLQFRYIFSQNQVSIGDFYLYELLKMIQAHSNSYLFKNKLFQFIADLEIQPQLQQYIFSSDQIQRSFLPNVFTTIDNFKDIILSNLKTFIDIMILEGGMYQFKGTLNTNQTIQYTDHIPFSGFPRIIDRKDFDQLRSKQLLWNKLIDKMSRDEKWIEQIFKNMNDEFLQRFIGIWHKTQQSKFASKVNVAIIRNDFMHDAQSNKWLQIEFNDIAVSFVQISDKVQQFHRTLFNSYYLGLGQQFESLNYQNKTIIGDTLYTAFQIYGQPNAKVLFIVGDFEGNTFDQRGVEHQLLQHGVLSLRKSFNDLIKQMTLNDQGKLFVNQDEIAIAYFRNGYSPSHYENEDMWKVREIIEISSAIKCPSIALLLVNFKKIQQVLQDENQLRRFLTQEESDIIKENFAQILDFDDEQLTQSIIQTTKDHPDDYVLKPQREGGGNNIYGEDIYKQLIKMSNQERKNFILMQKVKMQPQIGYLIKNKQLEVASVVSEIGIVAAFISIDDKLITNELGGYLCRTKKYLENEGGVATGYAVIDSLAVKKYN